MSSSPAHQTDLAIIGAGAAGLAAAIFAGEAAGSSPVGILLLDGAARPGAKILVSGGGRCNVTNAGVTPESFCGGPRPIIAKVLRAFDGAATTGWMRSLGVELKVEPEGKLFPVTDSSRTVLDALLRRVEELCVRCWWGCRVEALTHLPGEDHPWRVRPSGGAAAILARRVIVATGGLSLPKSGSDGAGLEWMRSLGHTIVPVTPALAPLVLRGNPSPGGRLAELSGMTLEVRLALAEPSGRRIADRTASAVFTHFGISGPAAMDLSRHLARWRLEHPGAEPHLTMGHPHLATVEDADRWLLDRARANPSRLAATAAADLFPDRLAKLLAGDMGRLGDLTRPQRRELATRFAALSLDCAGDRGYAFAEATAGGVSLREVDSRTMESRVAAGLHLCGEMLDVDGRIGGYNFQWAWASGYLAGRGAVSLLNTPPQQE